MPIPLPSRLLCACLFAFAVGACVPSFALPLMDLRAEDWLPMASESRKSLNLNANQQALWQQVETRSRTILRERMQRRAALQEKAKAMLARPDVELRELNTLVETENALAVQEDRQLRALWLDVNDALDDAQRRQVAVFIGEQLVRVTPEGRPGGERGGQRGERGGERGGRGAGGHGRGINIGG